MAETTAEDIQDAVSLDWRRDDDTFTINMQYGHAKIVTTDTQTEFDPDGPSDMEMLLAMVPRAIDIVMEQAFPNPTEGPND